MWVFRPLVFIVVALAFTACSVSPPGRTETAVMTTLKRRVTVGGAKEKNPLPPTPENVVRGRQVFSSYCVACHGLDGQATGVPFASAMSPPVPDLNSPAVQAYADGQLKWVIAHGLSPSGMPAANGILRDEEMWAIVTYLRHLPAKGSLGEPAMYGGDPAPSPHP
ncbi:MAG: cytochrome c [Acidobacteriia bacterium]|nr:cytochrome c [Terriglobia bacterium]